MAEEPKGENPNEAAPTTPVTPDPAKPDEFDTSEPDFFGAEEQPTTPTTPVTPTKPTEDISEDDAKTIAEVTGQAVAPVKQAVDAVTGEVALIKRGQEIDGFLNSEDGKVFKEFAEQIKKHALNPKLQHIKISALAPAIVGTKNLLKIGAKMASQANTEANADATAGGNARTAGEQAPGAQAVWAQGKEDFAQMVEDVKSGKVKELK